MAEPTTPQPANPSAQEHAPASGARIAGRVLAFEPVWLLGLTPLLILPGRLLPESRQWVFVLAALLFWPLRWLWQGSVTPPSPVRLSAGLLLLCFPSAIWAAADRTRAWEAAGYVVLGAAWANALINLPYVQRRPEAIAWILLLMEAGSLCWALSF